MTPPWRKEIPKPKLSFIVLKFRHFQSPIKLKKMSNLWHTTTHRPNGETTVGQDASEERGPTLLPEAEEREETGAEQKEAFV